MATRKAFRKGQTLKAKDLSAALKESLEPLQLQAEDRNMRSGKAIRALQEEARLMFGKDFCGDHKLDETKV